MNQEKLLKQFPNAKPFSFFDKPIEELSDSELISWYISFCNGADINSERDQQALNEFMSEVPNRSEEFQSKIDYISSVI